MKKFMIKLAKDAGKILLDNFDKIGKIEKKGKRDIVTDVDIKVEEFVLSRIREKYPLHSILSEEFGKKSGDNHLWIIDPLDGTKNYAAHLPDFNISIAFVQNGEIVNAVVFVPVLNELFYAERGKGAFLNGKRINVSSIKSLSKSFVCFCRGEEDSTIKKATKLYTKLADKTSSLRQVGSAELELSFIAAGRFDAFFSKEIKIWDIAAGALIVEEAGGKVTDFEGKKFNINSKDVVASNGKIHSSLLKYLNCV